MRKGRKVAATLAAVMTISCLAGCGKQVDSDAASNSSETKASVLVNYSRGLTDDGFYEGIKATDYVTLPDDYMAIPAESYDVAVDDYTISNFMAYLQANAGKTEAVTDRAAQLGDSATVSYVGKVDGKEFLGGTVDNHYVTLGMNDLVSGFEDQIIGHKVGDKFQVTVTFPEDYQATEDTAGNEMELAGKEATFDVTLNGLDIKVLNDEDVAEFFGEDTLMDGSKVDTVEKAMQYYTERQELTNRQDFVENYLIENSTVSELPESVIGQQLKIEQEYAEKQAADNGYDSAEAFLKEYGYDDMDAYLEECREDAETATKRTLILQAVAEEQNIKPQESSFNAYFGGDPSLALETYGQGYTAQLALDYEVKNVLQQHMVITESDEPEAEEDSSMSAASSKPEDVSIDASKYMAG